MSSHVPSYRVKKCPGGRKYAVVSLPDGMGGRRDLLLGKYGTKETRARYVKEIAEWDAGDRCLPSREAR